MAYTGGSFVATLPSPVRGRLWPGGQPGARHGCSMGTRDLRTCFSSRGKSRALGVSLDPAPTPSSNENVRARSRTCGAAGIAMPVAGPPVDNENAPRGAGGGSGSCLASPSAPLAAAATLARSGAGAGRAIWPSVAGEAAGEAVSVVVAAVLVALGGDEPSVTDSNSTAGMFWAQSGDDRVSVRKARREWEQE